MVCGPGLHWVWSKTHLDMSPVKTDRCQQCTLVRLCYEEVIISHLASTGVFYSGWPMCNVQEIYNGSLVAFTKRPESKCLSHISVIQTNNHVFTHNQPIHSRWSRQDRGKRKLAFSQLTLYDPDGEKLNVMVEQGIEQQYIHNVHTAVFFHPDHIIISENKFVS